MNDKIPYRLISKNLCGESSPEEDETLFQWMGNRPENQAIFEQCLSSVSGEEIVITSEEIIRRLEKIRTKPEKYLMLWKIAACFLLIAIVPALLLIKNSEESKTRPSTVQTIMLPDGSEVWLNKGSHISFDTTKFEINRTITVEGEALVRVAASKHPLLLFYGNGLVARLQTGEIHIRSYSHEVEKVAVVLDGIVAFSDNRGIVIEVSTDEEVIATAEHGLISSSINTNVNFNSWLTCIYAFDEIPLSSIISSGPGQISESDLSGIDRYQLVSGVFQLDGQQPLLELLKLLKEQKAISKQKKHRT